MTPDMDFSALDAISGGDVSPLEARGIVRRLLNSDAPAEAGERIYAALREVTFQALVSRAFSGEIVGWFEVFKQVAALLRSRGLEGTAERLRVLSDMAGQAARFAEAHPIDEVLNRRHVRALLQTLLAKAGSAYRADIAKELNIGEANLSRIISNLVVAGLVERRAAGRQAELRLTELAKEKLAAAKPRLSSDAAASLDWQNWPLPIAAWNGDGIAVGHNAAFAALDPAMTPPQDGAAAGWLGALRKRGLQIEGSPDGTFRDLRIANGRWVRAAHRPLADKGEIVFLYDVSDDRQAQQNANILAESWKVEKAGLQRQIADAEMKLRSIEHRIGAYRLAQRSLGEELVGRLSAMTRDGYIICDPHGAVPVASMGELRGLQRTVETVFGAPDVSGATSGALEVFDPRGYLQEVMKSESNICLDDRGLHEVQAPPALKASLNYILEYMLKTLGASPNGMRLIATVQDASLTVEISLRHASDQPRSYEALLSSPWDRALPVRMPGLAYCQILANDYGGSLEVSSEPHTLHLKLSFPVREFPDKPAQGSRFGMGFAAPFSAQAAATDTLGFFKK